MSTRILLGALMVLLLVVFLFPTGLGAPELGALLLITVAVFSAWRWKRRKSSTRTV